MINYDNLRNIFSTFDKKNYIIGDLYLSIFSLYMDYFVLNLISRETFNSSIDNLLNLSLCFLGVKTVLDFGYILSNYFSEVWSDEKYYKMFYPNYYTNNPDLKLLLDFKNLCKISPNDLLLLKNFMLSWKHFEFVKDKDIENNLYKVQHIVNSTTMENSIIESYYLIFK